MILKKTLQLSLILTILFVGLFVFTTPAHAVWTFEDKLNSDTKSTGDIDGQNGWTADTDYDIVTTDPFEGDQHAAATGANGTAQVSLSAVNTGAAYVAIQHNGTGDATWHYKSGGTTVVRVQFESSNITTFNNSTGVTLVSSYATDQYWIPEVIFNGDDTFDIRVWDTVLLTWVGDNDGLDYDFGASGDPDQVQMNQGSSGVVFFDNITPTAPDAVAEVVVDDTEFQVIEF